MRRGVVTVVAALWSIGSWPTLSWAASAAPARASNKSLTLTIGEGSSRVSLTFAALPLDSAAGSGQYLLHNAIRGFSIPATKLAGPLTRKTIGGDEAVNEIRIHREGGQTSLTFRLSTHGTGGGEGNAGASIVVAVNLDKPVVRGTVRPAFVPGASGMLSGASGRLKATGDIVRQDLDAVGAKSPAYASIAGIGDSGTLYWGFAIFDPTNPKSIRDAYFELSSSESALRWELE